MFDPHLLRKQFPALHKKRDGRLPIFLDGPGGTQVPQRVIDAMVHYLGACNANHGGSFATSVESDTVLSRAHEAVADLLNAPSAEEIVFGQNMTSLTLHLSRSFARTLKDGDEVMVTRLDHDANVSPWALAARDAGAVVKWIDVRSEDCTLDLEDYRRQLGPRTRLVAVGLASNAVGTINDVAAVARLAHEFGALAFVDAVHYAPHGPIDVEALGCDFLACSAYKFFGPHVGVLWGKRELLEKWPVYKLRPSPDTLPGRWMTGTQNHEGIAGVAAAVEYLAEIGSHVPRSAASAARSPRRAALVAAMTAIQEYERGLSRRLLEGLAQRPRFKVWGITDGTRLTERVPTISITLPDLSPHEIAEHLAARHIYVWAGNMYALEISERLGLEQRGGFVRLGLVHYNTADEITRLLLALDELGYKALQEPPFCS
jgi:cysteine desulfurase family protein (TIGR01976 family)